MNTKQKLETIALNSLYITQSNVMMIEYCFDIFKRFLRNGSILELGPAEGIMTQKLIQCTDDLTVIEGSSIFCEQLQQRFPSIHVVNELFENYKPRQVFDNIVLGHVLEHVDNPTEILQNCREWLAPEGIILAAVPNSQSIHRQAAVLMNLLETEESMSELDIHHGHQRIFNPFTLRNSFKKAGLRIVHYGGFWLKPVSNAQIHESWSESMLSAFMQLGERYPDISAEIYVIASK